MLRHPALEQANTVEKIEILLEMGPRAQCVTIAIFGLRQLRCTGANCFILDKKTMVNHAKSDVLKRQIARKEKDDLMV